MYRMHCSLRASLTVEESVKLCLQPMALSQRLPDRGCEWFLGRYLTQLCLQLHVHQGLGK